jgi:2-polyprenyl-3-methyl-5-hydroxy-6-metoxy-1,4-benzoquinol methylase
MRFKKIEGLDYKRGAIEYPNKLEASDRHHLLTKPFYDLAQKHARWPGEGLDADTHRHFCDFANLAVALALPPGARILDVGCGSGWLCEYFARFGYDVTGIDISSELIAMADERLSKVPYGSDHEKGLEYRFLVHDIEAAALEETFDAVICYDSLHHFENEQSVLKHLATMLGYGGQLFVLEGERPPTGSETERELRTAMQQYETLESPFSRDYLLSLLRGHGFAIVGDYLSVNGLFDRETLAGDRLLLTEPPVLNYLLCKKVSSRDGGIPDSRNPGVLRAKITLHEEESAPSLGPRASRPQIPDPLTLEDQIHFRVDAGTVIHLLIEIENTGDTLWLVSRSAPKGTVRLGVKILNEAGEVIDEVHGSPPLPRAIAPRETLTLNVKHSAPAEAGRYTLKIDLVCQDICWFEQQGSNPLVLNFEVRS